MKTIILSLLLSVIFTMGGYSQSSKLPAGATEHITTTAMIQYYDMEEGWEKENNRWYFYNNEIMVTPVTYEWVETIDSTYMSKVNESKIQIKIREKSTGNYKTTEEGWSWEDGSWSFNDAPVRSYPPSFIKEATITKERSENESTLSEEHKIEKYYTLEDDKWTWNTSNNSWLYENTDTIGLPTYKVIRSREVVNTLQRH